MSKAEFTEVVTDEEGKQLFVVSRVDLGSGDLDASQLKLVLESQLGSEADVFEVLQLPGEVSCGFIPSNEFTISYGVNTNKDSLDVNMVFVFAKNEGRWVQYGFVSQITDCLFHYYDKSLCETVRAKY